METIFINSLNSKTSNHHRLLISFSYKINLRRNHKYVALLDLSNYYKWKNIQKFI